MVLPGLNAPLDTKIAPLPDDPEYRSRLADLRKEMDMGRKGRSKHQHPLERGWTSAKFGGRNLGPPDPIGKHKWSELLMFGITPYMIKAQRDSFSVFIRRANVRRI